MQLQYLTSPLGVAKWHTPLFLKMIELAANEKMFIKNIPGAKHLISVNCPRLGRSRVLVDVLAMS